MVVVVGGGGEGRGEYCPEPHPQIYDNNNPEVYGISLVLLYTYNARHQLQGKQPHTQLSLRVLQKDQVASYVLGMKVVYTK